jgi:threonine aldolase
LSLMAGPINSICVHEKSHVYLDECNAPEFFSGGARLSPMQGEGCKISLSELAKAATTIGQQHSPQPSAVSITQTTEIGSVYSIAEIKQISVFVKQHDLKLHMDGARFANAVASVGCSPAEMTWQAGVDALSFGATKNGCMAAEAVVLFDQSLIDTAMHRQKRAGQLMSKQRFLAAQLGAYLDDGLWLSNAQYSNQQTTALASMLANIEGVELPDSIGSNMMFVKFTQAQIDNLESQGIAGYVYADGKMRLCCSWATTAAELQQFVACVAAA